MTAEQVLKCLSEAEDQHVDNCHTGKPLNIYKLNIILVNHHGSEKKPGFPGGLYGRESACNARDPYSSGTILCVEYAAESKIPVLLVLSF